MVSFTTSVSWPLAAVTSVFKFPQTCRNWATRSPLPTTRPSRSLATWPARNSVRPPRVSAAWEKPTAFGSDGGLWNSIWRVIVYLPPSLPPSGRRAVEHDRLSVRRVVVEQLDRNAGDFGGLDQPAAGVQVGQRRDRFVEGLPRSGRDVACAAPHEIGRREPRADGVDGDPLARDLGGERARQADQRVLGGRVGGDVR